MKVFIYSIRTVPAILCGDSILKQGKIQYAVDSLIQR